MRKELHDMLTMKVMYRHW